MKKISIAVAIIKRDNTKLFAQMLNKYVKWVKMVSETYLKDLAKNMKGFSKHSWFRYEKVNNMIASYISGIYLIYNSQKEIVKCNDSRYKKFAKDNCKEFELDDDFCGGFDDSELNEPLERHNWQDNVKKTYLYVLFGLGLTGISSVYLHKIGFSKIISNINPWICFASSLVILTPLLINLRWSSYEQEKLKKHLYWVGWNVSMGSILSGIGAIGYGLLFNVAIATLGLMVGLSLFSFLMDPCDKNMVVNQNKTSTKFLDNFSKPLCVGLGLLISANFSQLVYPMPI